MASNFNLLCSLHLLLSTPFCLHVSLERNINFVHEISHVKYNASRKFLRRNIFVRKRIAENFSHELFGIEINVDENKANCGMCDPSSRRAVRELFALSLSSLHFTIIIHYPHYTCAHV